MFGENFQVVEVQLKKLVQSQHNFFSCHFMTTLRCHFDASK